MPHYMCKWLGHLLAFDTRILIILMVYPLLPKSFGVGRGGGGGGGSTNTSTNTHVSNITNVSNMLVNVSSTYHN